MRRLAFLSVISVLAGAPLFGCGGRLADDDGAHDTTTPAAGAGDPAAPGDGAANASNHASPRVVFDCAEDTPYSSDPDPPPAPRLVVEHLGGRTIRVNGVEHAFAVVDKEGPYAGRFINYWFRSNDGGSVRLDGSTDNRGPLPSKFLIDHPGSAPDTEYWICEPFTGGTFDDAFLDALVTETGGRRTLVGI